MTRTKDVGLSCSLHMIPLFIKERSATALQHHHYNYKTLQHTHTRRPTNATVDSERFEPIHTHTHNGQEFGLGPGDDERIPQASLEGTGHERDWESGQDDLFVAIYGRSSRS